MDIKNQRRGALIASNFHRLLALDEIWTTYLEQTTAIPSSDIEELRSIVGEMDRILAALQEDFLWMIPIATAHTNEFVADLEDAIRTADAPAVKKTRLRDYLRKLGSHNRALKQVQGSMVIAIPKARKELARKIRVIENGKYTPGDLTRREKCLISVALGLGGYWCPPLIGAGVGGMLNFCL